MHGLSMHELRTASGLASSAWEGGRDESLFSTGCPEGRRELGTNRASQSRVYLFVYDTCLSYRMPGLHDPLGRETGRQRSGVGIYRYRVEIVAG
jgi:hypothetical protein